ncbi:MAG: PfkB family carbohydrate kinase [Candidatus Nitrosotenuis sp.]
MNLAIFSHCTIDEIKINNNLYERPGGPACYCGITARNLGFDVELVTKYGPDYTFVDQLQKNKIKFENAQSQRPTTRFRLEINDTDRTLWIKNTCDKIDYIKTNVDGILISPVFDEISYETLERLKSDAKLVALDPQGFLRRAGSDGKVNFEKTTLNLEKIHVLKSDPSEVQNLTGVEGIDGAKLLHKKVEHLLYTNKRDVSLFYKNKQYTITLPNMDIYDTSGVGDIFTATYCCTMLKEKDALWALSFAGGAAQAALESKEIGLDKIPLKATIETNASYFYNIMKFRDV